MLSVYQVTGLTDVAGGTVTTTGHAGTTADPYPATTLRAAITTAITDQVADTITFASDLAGKTIALHSLPVSQATDPTNATEEYGSTAFLMGGTSNITLDGSGAPGLTISAGGNQRFFVVQSTAELTLENLTLTDGLARGGGAGVANAAGGGGGGGAGLGGAVFDDGGTVTADGCTFTNNIARGGQGGASPGSRSGGGGGGGGGGMEFSYGTGSKSLNAGFNGGSGVGGAGGGHAGGYRGGNATIGGMMGPDPGGPGGFGGGGGGGAGEGGGNVAGGGAGGFGAGGGGGGGYLSGGVGHGGAGGFGGGGGGHSGPGGFGGGAGAASSPGRSGGGGGAGLGGAIFSNGGSLVLENDTFTGNTASGGKGNSGGGAGSGLGGAVFARNGSLNALFVTFTANTAAQGGTDVFALSDSSNGGNSTSTGSGTVSVSLIDSILGQSSASVSDFVANATAGASAPVLTGGYDLISNNAPTSGSGFAGANVFEVISGVDPDLGSLGFNGGFTDTIPLLSGSPAIGAGTSATYYGTTNPINVDQRGAGFVRSASTPDIGAFDVQVVSQTLLSVNAINLVAGGALTNWMLSGSGSAMVNGQSVNVPGTLVFTTAAGTVPVAGVQSESVTFTPADPYHFTTANGSVTVNVNAAPTVATLSATALLPTGATLNGTVNPQGNSTSAGFQYSTSPAFSPNVVSYLGGGYSSPVGLAVGPSGNVIVADDHLNDVKEVQPNGQVVFTYDGFNNPSSVAIDAAGDLYVADFLNNVVKEFLPNGASRTIGPAFPAPYGVAVDASGDVFVADALNGVEEVLPDGTTQTVATGLGGSSGLALDAAGDIYVAETPSNQVVEILHNNGGIKTIGSGFDFPSAVAVDAAGDVFVADSGNNAVKEVLPGGTILTLGSGFSNPQGVAVDAAGDVFISDTDNSRIVELSPTTVFASPSIVSGSTATAVSATLSGLATGATYYDRIFAAGPGGTVVGTTGSFTAPVSSTITLNGPATSSPTYGQQLTFTANVSYGGAPITAGTVTFLDGSTVLMSGVPLTAQGQAVFTTSTLATGSHSVTAQYSGTTGYTSSNSGAIALGIAQRPLTVTANPQSVTQGYTMLPALTYSITAGSLIGTDALGGALASSPGTSVGDYPITQGSLTAGSNYALTFVPSVLFVTSASAPLASGKSVAVSTTTPATASITPASPGGPQLSATGSGFNGVLTVAQYQSDPNTGVYFAGSYFDINISGGAPASAASVQATFSGLAPNVPLTWSNNGTQQPVISGNMPVVTNSTGSATVTFNQTSSPTLAQLVGTEFFAGTYTPSLSLAAGKTVVAGAGLPLTATATLAGGNAETGTMTFTLTSPGGATVDTEGVSVSGNGTYSTPNGYLPKGAGAVTGTYLWTASYSGDGFNNGITASPGAVPESVIAASPTLSAAPGAAVVIGSGAKLTASATLAAGFNPGGTITFTLTSPTGATVDTETVPVNGNGAYTTPSGYLPATPGTYEWVVSYSGDANNNHAGTSGSPLPEIAVGSGVTLVGNVLYLVGGGGNDQLNIQHIGSSNTGSTGITISGQLNGANVNNINYPTAPVAIDLVLFNGNDTVNMQSTLNLPATVSDGNGNDSITLGQGNNSVTVGSGRDYVQAGDGNNTVAANTAAGQVTVNLGNGNNTVTVTDTSAAQANVFLGDGNNSVTVGNGKDNVQAGNEYGSLFSCSGNNDQYGNGNNTVTAGDGNDNIYLGNGNNAVNVGNGNDNIQLGAAHGFLFGWAGYDQLGTGNNTVNAGNGNDNIFLGNGNNAVNVGNGSDNIQAGDGWAFLFEFNDGQQLGAGNNTITAGNGNDNVFLGNGNNVVTAGSGTDDLLAGNGNNLLVGGVGTDNILAGNGDNLLIAGLGHDNLLAGNGSNILIDGSVQLTAARLVQVLGTWEQGATSTNIASITSQLMPALTYNTTNRNVLGAGSGKDWFWYTFSKDQVNKKATDLLN
jgi:hypothetical protein